MQCCAKEDLDLYENGYKRHPNYHIKCISFNNKVLLLNAQGQNLVFKYVGQHGPRNAKTL